MAHHFNKPFANEHDLEANLSPSTSPSLSPSPLPSQNPFLESPSIPPPAYNFHAESSNLLLPHNANITISRSSSPNPFKRSHEIEAYERKQQYNRRRFLCCTLAIIMMIFIAIVVTAVVFRWGQNNVCVRWNDGTTSGHCN